VDILSLTFRRSFDKFIADQLVLSGRRRETGATPCDSTNPSRRLAAGDRSSVAVIAGKIPCCFMRLSSHLLGRPVLKRFIPHHSLQANPNQRAISGCARSTSSRTAEVELLRTAKKRLEM
jgi:hypothetical protein